MSLLFQVIRSSYCRSTHHYLALDALPLLRGPKVVRWQSIFLRHYEAYLEGAKDPDKVFRDFENHVLHVRDGYWGGACERARYWYDATVRALQASEWEAAAYNAGVMTHYVTDPMMPLHTAQSKQESNIHRALEWSVCKTYEPIWKLTNEKLGLPFIEPGTNESWLEELVTAGAEIANGYYDALIQQYDFTAGRKNPPKGLPQSSREMIAQMFGFATVSLARILERACREAGDDLEPPLALPSLDWFFASLEVPIEWVAKKMEDSQEAEMVRAQYREYLEKGEVDETLSEDVRVIRDLCSSATVPADPPVPSPTPPTKTSPAPPTASPKTSPPVPAPVSSPRNAPAPTPANSTSAPDVTRRTATGSLDGSAPIVKAPSIGPKTAARLALANVRTVDDLLQADPAVLAAELDVRYMDEQTLRDWQDQSRLMMTIPRIYGHDAQILVGAGFRDAESVARAQPEELLAEVLPFVQSEKGQRLVREESIPDLSEVTHWIGCAEEALPLESASVELAS